MNDIYDEFYKLFEEGNFHCGSRVTERIRVRQYKLQTMKRLCDGMRLVLEHFTGCKIEIVYLKTTLRFDVYDDIGLLACMVYQHRLNVLQVYLKRFEDGHIETYDFAHEIVLKHMENEKQKTNTST